MKPIILITGPTATGKTRTSINLCKFLIKNNIASEVINFDSLIFYRELNIGSAKPSDEELTSVPHHLINTHSIRTPLNASDYSKLAKGIIHKLHQESIVPILVGGSAFYIRALIKGMYESETTPIHVKERIETIRSEHGHQALREKLKEVDEDSWHHIHQNDDYRTVRALEHFYTHNSPLSIQRKKIEENKPYDFSLGKTQDPDWSILNFYLEIPTEQHWPMIKERTQEMIRCGLIDEVKSLLTEKESSPLQSIGYKETISYIEQSSSLKNEEELIEAIYIATRQLAKSQKTFFKKIIPKITLNPLDNIEDECCQKSLSFLHDLSR